MFNKLLKIVGLGLGMWSLGLIWLNFGRILASPLILGLTLGLLMATGLYSIRRRYWLPVTRSRSISKPFETMRQTRVWHSLPTKPVHPLNIQRRHSQPTRPMKWKEKTYPTY